MAIEQLSFPAIYHDGVAYFLERSETWTSSYFGGPTDVAITGIHHGARKLHHLATIKGDCFGPLWQLKGGGVLRLLYGMCFEGCEMKYRNTVGSSEIFEMSPSASSENWPYPDYPVHFPYFPLRLRERVQCTPNEFSAVAGMAPTRDEALVVVPSNPVLGVSLWGPSGDQEGVRVIFRCDLERSHIEAFNLCH